MRAVQFDTVKACFLEVRSGVCEGSDNTLDVFFGGGARNSVLPTIA
jgi:hypothetical protein